MERRGVRIIVTGVFIFTFFAFCVPASVFAANTDVAQLQQSIAEKKASIATLNAQLDAYREKIRALAGKGASLQNDVALLENETALATLDLAATQNAMDEETLELRILDSRIQTTEDELARRRAMLADLLVALQRNDNQGVLSFVANAENMFDVFDATAQLTRVNDDMKSALEATKMTKDTLYAHKALHEEKVVDLGDTAKILQKKANDLDMRKNAKLVLVNATEESENQYRTLMSELRTEQQSITSEVSGLQDTLQDKLRARDGDQVGDTVISWPVHGVITALFHDPSYPFRNLFEHPGLDIAVPQGTAIEAAAPGYVGRVYKGQQYGYYVLLIHANGFATLYAHMSRIDVEQDQYVSRGQVIGLSGGRPGTVGAGFSTGPHTHFEVRLNGIPVNPLPYLPTE